MVVKILRETKGNSSLASEHLIKTLIIQKISKVVSKLATTATTVTKGVAKDMLYLNTWWCGNLAVAVAAYSDTDLDLKIRKFWRILFVVTSCR